MNDKFSDCSSHNNLNDDVFEAILPLKVTGNYQDYDLDRAKILLNSLHCNWKGLYPLNVTIVSPSNSLDLIATQLIGRSTRLSINLVDELDLCPQLNSFPADQHWYKQQVIKLMAHKIINTKYCLTLDADIILYKMLNPHDVFIGGRILTGWENKVIHSEWWSVSANILGLSNNIQSEHGMHPTPQFLSTHALRELEEYLNSKYFGDAWSYLLNNRGWTEYTIYNLFLDMTQSLHHYHHPLDWAVSNNIAMKSWRSFSTIEQYNTWNPAPAFELEEPGFFAVLNSSSKIPPANIWEKIRKFYPDSVFD